MKYLHTMIRVADLERSKRFYSEALGFSLVKERRYENGRFTLAFMRAPGEDESGPTLELTHNWDTDRYELGNAYGHMAYQVSSIAEIQTQLQAAGYDLSRGPTKTPDGRRAMAFVNDPDGYAIELLEGE